MRRGRDRRGGAVLHDADAQRFVPELLEIAAPLLLRLVLPIVAHQRVIVGLRCRRAAPPATLAPNGRHTAGATCGCWMVIVPSKARASPQALVFVRRRNEPGARLGGLVGIEGEADRQRHALQRGGEVEIGRRGRRPGWCPASAGCRPCPPPCRQSALAVIPLWPGGARRPARSAGPSRRKRPSAPLIASASRWISTGCSRRHGRSARPRCCTQILRRPLRAKPLAVARSCAHSAGPAPSRAGEVAQRRRDFVRAASADDDPPWRRSGSACSRSRRPGSSGRRSRRAGARAAKSPRIGANGPAPRRSGRSRAATITSARAEIEHRGPAAGRRRARRPPARCRDAAAPIDAIASPEIAVCSAAICAASDGEVTVPVSSRSPSPRASPAAGRGARYSAVTKPLPAVDLAVADDRLRAARVIERRGSSPA